MKSRKPKPTATVTSSSQSSSQRPARVPPAHPGLQLSGPPTASQAKPVGAAAQVKPEPLDTQSAPAGRTMPVPRGTPRGAGPTLLSNPASGSSGSRPGSRAPGRVSQKQRPTPSGRERSDAAPRGSAPRSFRGGRPQPPEKVRLETDVSPFLRGFSVDELITKTRAHLAEARTRGESVGTIYGHLYLLLDVARGFQTPTDDPYLDALQAAVDAAVGLADRPPPLEDLYGNIVESDSPSLPVQETPQEQVTDMDVDGQTQDLSDPSGVMDTQGTPKTWSPRDPVFSVTPAYSVGKPLPSPVPEEPSAPGRPNTSFCELCDGRVAGRLRRHCAQHHLPWYFEPLRVCWVCHEVTGGKAFTVAGHASCGQPCITEERFALWVRLMNGLVHRLVAIFRLRSFEELHQMMLSYGWYPRVTEVSMVQRLLMRMWEVALLGTRASR